MSWLDKFKFAQPTKAGTVSDGSQQGARVGLTDDQAVSQLVTLLTRLPDLDEVLKQLGVKRYHLRALEYDDEIYQANETRCDALLATPVHYTPAEAPHLEDFKGAFEPVLRAAITGAWQARKFGYSVLEAVYYRNDKNNWAFIFLGEKPMEWFDPRPDGSLRYYPDNGSGGPLGVTVDQRYKFFMTRANPTYRMPHGDAMLSRLYWPWFFRTNGWKFWGKFLERFGSPLLVGHTKKPTEMLQALLLAHSQSVMAIDRDDKVEAVGPQGSNTGAAFESFETAVVRRIQKVILGQTLTSGTDGGSGNRALGQVHDAVRRDKRDSDIELVTPTLQKAADALCELNSWPRTMVEFKDETGLNADQATRDKTLYEVGVRFEPSYIQNAYDLSAEDFTMTEANPVDSTPGLPGLPSGAPTSSKGKTGDAKGTPNAGKGVKAAQTLQHLFKRRAAENKFTADQAVLENQIDSTDQVMPLDPAKVRAAVMAATSPEDLCDKLFALIGGDVSEPEFRVTLERALYAADVLGYVSAEV